MFYFVPEFEGSLKPLVLIRGADHEKIFFLAAFLFISLYLLVSHANSTTYYVSWSSALILTMEISDYPLMSLNRASSGPNEGYQSGDLILFKRGDIWDITQASNRQVWGSLTIGLKISKSGTTGKVTHLLVRVQYCIGCRWR